MRGLLSERSNQKPQQGGGASLDSQRHLDTSSAGQKTGQSLANPHEQKSRINLPMRTGTKQSRANQTWTVVDDFPDAVPVTPEELDVVEAFLMAQFRAIMEGEGAASNAGLPAPDSETPQIHADVGTSTKGRRSRR
jgi:hypothetical protein